MMTPDKIKTTGIQFNNCFWTDKELADQIQALELVIAYFQGRGDAKLVWFPLVLDLIRFQDMAKSRKGY